MRKFLGFFFFVSWLAATPLLSDTQAPKELIPLDAPWKKSVYAFAVKKLQHSAWGVAHSRRDYLMALEIAVQDGLSIDKDALFAAAFLHDMGGFEEFAKKGVDHAVRSAELVESILKPMGFPESKLDTVKAAILAHTYYNPKAPTSPEEIALHDADVLDFLGSIGNIRIFSLVERDSVAPDLLAGVKILQNFQKQLPLRLVSPYARKLGAARAAEMKSTLDSLEKESFGWDAL